MLGGLLPRFLCFINIFVQVHISLKTFILMQHGKCFVLIFLFGVEFLVSFVAQSRQP